MRWYPIFILIGLLVLACAGWYSRVIYAAYMETAAACMYPFLRIHQTLIRPIYVWCENFKQYNELVREHNQLREAYRTLQGVALSNQSTMSYAQDVIKELDWFKKRFNAEYLCIVPIMGVHQSDRQHTAIIEGGSDRGIQRDMILLADNVLIGKITTVYAWYSVAQLITDPASCIAVYGINSTAHGIVHGTGSTDTLTLERVNHLSPVQEQELLLTSGDGMVIPRGYGVGIVEKYSSDGLYYTGIVKTLINPAELRTCVIIDRAHLLKTG